MVRSLALRSVFFLAAMVCLLVAGTLSAQAMPFEVTNLQITAQSTDAVKARELALAQAQRKALAILIGKNDTEIESVTDTQIARLVRGFSVRRERLAARAYTANFTIRFNPNATISFVQQNGYQFAFSGQTGVIDANPTATNATAPNTTTTVTDNQGENPADTTDLVDPQPQDTAAATIDRSIVILPVLDMGQQQVLWSDPNPWREVWQAKDYSQHGLAVRVPLGDIADVTDVPDTGFLSGAQYNFVSLLNRYTAGNTFITVFKNQGSGGVLLSLYRHDGSRLAFIRKMVVNPRPGFRFEDAVPAALQMVIMAHNNNAGGTNTQNQNDPEPAEQATTHTLAQAADRAGANTAASAQSFNITIPYQSLQQWVAIQNRLRRVNGITTITPIRVSPSSAHIRIQANVSDVNDLKRHLATQQFDLQHLPTGEIVLIEQFR